MLPPSPGGSAAPGDAEHRPERPGWGDGATAFTPTRRHFVSPTSPLQGQVKNATPDIAVTTPS
jgi:hypothetical protein